MHATLTKLISSGSAPLAPAISTDMITAVPVELTDLLTGKNGFYAFESALLVRPWSSAVAPFGIVEWNVQEVWKTTYTCVDLTPYLFFAEDLFGGQWGLREGDVYLLEPETGQLKEVGTIAGWAERLLAEYSIEVAHPLAHQWQNTWGRLPPGTRLVPKVPFVLGGAYDVSNLRPSSDVEAMRIYGNLASQIHDLPDGATVRIDT